MEEKSYKERFDNLLLDSPKIIISSLIPIGAELNHSCWRGILVENSNEGCIVQRDSPGEEFYDVYRVTGGNFLIRNLTLVERRESLI